MKFNIWDKRREQPFMYLDVKANNIIRIHPLFETVEDANIWLVEFFREEGKVSSPENLFDLYEILEYM